MLTSIQESLVARLTFLNVDDIVLIMDHPLTQNDWQLGWVTWTYTDEERRARSALLGIFALRVSHETFIINFKNNQIYKKIPFEDTYLYL